MAVEGKQCDLKEVHISTKPTTFFVTNPDEDTAVLFVRDSLSEVLYRVIIVHIAVSHCAPTQRQTAQHSNTLDTQSPQVCSTKSMLLDMLYRWKWKHEA
ncbi:hypothetical protein ElyMa_003423600 [Elysia marginata]|uniref:Uncharacterized protein n=1 Tax=Elysia marginata TaxID=1093978 RepID=A0AAV4JSN6_9GAST|nr:hypothetical protein ElyMa_003423600 [Elysia marginata]